MSTPARRWLISHLSWSQGAWLCAALFFLVLLATTVAYVTGAPMLPGLLAGAALALTLIVLRPAVGTILFLALAYANVPVLLGQLVGNAWLVGAAASGLIVLPAFLQVFVLRRGWLLDKPLLLMALFLAALLLSSFRARDVTIALQWIATYVVEGLVLYFLVINAVRTVGLMRTVLWTLVLVAALLSSLGIYQEVSGDYWTEFGGLAQRKIDRLELEDLDRDRSKIRASHRACGPVDDPNHFAQLLLAVFPAAFLLTRIERRRFSRGLALAATAVILGGFLLTYSRGGFLVLLLLLGLLVALGDLRFRHLLIGVTVIAAATVLLAPGYVQRMDTMRGLSRVKSDTEEWKQGDFAVRGRLTEMLASLNAFLDHPVIGVGPGQYAPFYSRQYMSDPRVAFRTIDWERRAHMLYFELGAETGLIGLSLFLGITGLVLLRLWRLRARWRRRHPLTAHIATALGLGIIAHLGTGMFLTFAFQRYYWMLVALAGATVHIAARHPVEAGAASGGAGVLSSEATYVESAR